MLASGQLGRGDGGDPGASSSVACVQTGVVGGAEQFYYFGNCIANHVCMLLRVFENMSFTRWLDLGNTFMRGEFRLGNVECVTRNHVRVRI